MDYELRIVVEKVAVGSQEVVKRDTINATVFSVPPQLST